jgi:hypothetical protein
LPAAACWSGLRHRLVDAAWRARAGFWLATDLNPETLAVARAKPLPPAVRFATVDAYTLDEPARGRPGGFDAAFAGCWWSHVPLARLPAWLDTCWPGLQPGARVVLLDNSFVQTSSTADHRRDADGNTYQQRTLDDGSVHEVLKNFPTADELRGLLGPPGQRLQWTAWTHYWACVSYWCLA